MAIALAIKLLNKQILIKPAQSVNSIVPDNGAAIGFGTVEALMPYNNNYSLTDSVCFSLSNAKKIVFNSITYLVISESDILFIEPPFAP